MTDWRDGSVQAYINGVEWPEIYAAYPEIKPECIRSHVRRSTLYKERNPVIDKPKRTYTLIVSDLHHPFNRPTILDEVALFAGKIDNLLFSEEQDCQSLSRFQKMYRKDVMIETIGTQRLVGDIIDAVNPKRTMVIKSNHPSRLGSYMSKRVEPDAMRFIAPSTTEYIVSGFKDYDHEGNLIAEYPGLNTKYDIEYIRDWYVKIGHHVYCHPDAYRSPVMGTAEIMGKYFVDAFRDVDSVSVAHTHHAGAYSYGSVMIYETGCCCLPCNYNLPDAKRPWSFALFLLVQDEDGNNVKNETRHIWLD